MELPVFGLCNRVQSLKFISTEMYKIKLKSILPFFSLFHSYSTHSLLQPHHALFQILYPIHHVPQTIIVRHRTLVIRFSRTEYPSLPRSSFTPRYPFSPFHSFTHPSIHSTPSAGSNAQKCLRADNKPNSPVVLTSCTGGSDQEWSWSNAAVTLYNGSKCLAVVNNQNLNGAKLQVVNCVAGDPSQAFEYTPWGENQYVSFFFWGAVRGSLTWFSIKWTRGTNKCVDLPDGNMNDGTQVQLYDCDWFNPNQNWNTGYLCAPTRSILITRVYTFATGTTNSPSYPKPVNRVTIIAVPPLRRHHPAKHSGSTVSIPPPHFHPHIHIHTSSFTDADDFCLWAPPTPSGGSIGDTERSEVAWCTKSGYGTRVIPDGTLTGVHFVKTKDYVQVTGVGDFTKINVQKGDYGGGPCFCFFVIDV